MPELLTAVDQRDHRQAFLPDGLGPEPLQAETEATVIEFPEVKRPAGASQRA
jgi:hypothetical protein